LSPFLVHSSQDQDEEQVVDDADGPQTGELSTEARARLPELVAELEGERTHWEELQATQTINEVEDFANQMRELGEEYGYAPLHAWGERLATEASAFDMAAMPQTMDEFAQIVGEARALSTS